MSDYPREAARMPNFFYPTQYGGPRGLLLHDARPLAHDGQFHHGGLQRGLGLVRLLVARVMEADCRIAASFSEKGAFFDAESRRESKISLTRRSLLRSSARLRSKNTPTSSPRRPNRPRPTPRIRRASRKPEASRSHPVPRHDVGRTTLAEYRVPA